MFLTKEEIIVTVIKSKKSSGSQLLKKFLRKTWKMVI